MAGCNEGAPPCEVLSEPACRDCATGSLQWLATYQGGVSTYVGGLAVDSCGGSLVVGRLAADRSAAAERAFVAKYRPDGTLAWIDISNHSLGDQWHDVASDGHGALVAGKSTRARQSWVEDDDDSVIASMSTNGDWLWRRDFDDGPHGSANHVIWLADDERIVASGKAEAYWLRVLDADGMTLFEDLAITASIREIAPVPGGGFVIATNEYVARHDADGVELQRHDVRGSDAVAVDANARISMQRSIWGIDVVEIEHDGTVTPWPMMTPEDDLHVVAIVMDDAEAVFAGFDTIDGQRLPWVRRYGADHTERWTWLGTAVGDREVKAAAIGSHGSIVVAGTSDASVVQSGGDDVDLWIGGIAL